MINATAHRIQVSFFTLTMLAVGCSTAPVELQFTTDQTVRMYVTQAPYVRSEFGTQHVLHPGDTLKLTDYDVPARVCTKHDTSSPRLSYAFRLRDVAFNVSEGSPFALTFRAADEAKRWYYDDVVMDFTNLRAEGDAPKVIKKHISLPFARYASEPPYRTLKEIADTREDKMEVVFDLDGAGKSGQRFRLGLLDRTGADVLALPTTQLLLKGRYIFTLEAPDGRKLTGMLDVQDTSHEMVKFTSISALRNVTEADLQSLFTAKTDVRLYSTYPRTDDSTATEVRAVPVTEEPADDQEILVNAFLGNRQSAEAVRLSYAEGRTLEIRFPGKFDVSLWDWTAQRWRPGHKTTTGDVCLVLPLGPGSGDEKGRSYIKLSLGGENRCIYGVFDLPSVNKDSAWVASFPVRLAEADFRKICNESSITRITGSYDPPEERGSDVTVYNLTLGRRNPSETIRRLETQQQATD